MSSSPLQPSDSPPSSEASSSNDASPPAGSPSNEKSSFPPPSVSQSNYNPWSPTGSSSSGNSSRIIGAAAGAGTALVLAMIALVVFFIWRKKQKARKAKYYNNDPQGNPNGYFANKMDQNWNNYGRFQDHKVMSPPQAGGSVKVSSEYGWALPPMMSSTDVSSAGYSASPGLRPPGMPLGFSQSCFSYEELAKATQGFSKSNLLGQGGFGFVHKGVMPNGKEVAVKSLKPNSGQGEREFQAEVETISRVHHRYLVSLVGYCVAGSRRMLVYEYVPNGNLEFHLHGEGRPPLDWPIRRKIALGAAKGFAYLHEDCHPRIIHRDIKAANILLDMNFNAKVADFGLAKNSQDDKTHVSTRIMGTFGYLAPEYASTGKLTEKSDVYSFGIMLLELISGRRPVDYSSDEEDSLVDWAMPILDHAIEGGSYEELVDPRLGKNYEEMEMFRMVSCAAACTRRSSRRRPKMSQIVRALEGDVSLDDLNIKQMGSRTNSEFDLRALAKGSGSEASSVSSQDFSNSNEVSSEK